MDTSTKRASAPQVREADVGSTPATPLPAPARAPYVPNWFDRSLDRVIDELERVMPSMETLGGAMLVFMLLLALSGNLAADDDTAAALQAAQEAAAATPNFVPF